MYSLTKDVLDETSLGCIETALLGSPYLGKSPLGDEFVNTKGFSIVFQRQQMQSVVSDFPYLKPFLERATFPKSNAFYLNPLVLSKASRVDAHVDCRLLPPENLRIIPTIVSVLYVWVDYSMIGGQLILNVGREPEIEIRPQSNHLVHFKGNIIHSVAEVSTGQPRISIVCEQYNLPDSILSHFPEYDVLVDVDTVPRVGAQTNVR